MHVSFRVNVRNKNSMLNAAVKCEYLIDVDLNENCKHIHKNGIVKETLMNEVTHNGEKILGRIE